MTNLRAPSNVTDISDARADARHPVPSGRRPAREAGEGLRPRAAGEGLPPRDAGEGLPVLVARRGFVRGTLIAVGGTVVSAVILMALNPHIQSCLGGDVPPRGGDTSRDRGTSSSESHQISPLETADTRPDPLPRPGTPRLTPAFTSSARSERRPRTLNITVSPTIINKTKVENTVLTASTASTATTTTTRPAVAGPNERAWLRRGVRRARENVDNAEALLRGLNEND